MKPKATPEPATVLIWSLLVGMGIFAGWRRRKAASYQPVTGRLSSKTGVALLVAGVALFAVTGVALRVARLTLLAVRKCDGSLPQDAPRWFSTANEFPRYRRGSAAQARPHPTCWHATGAALLVTDGRGPARCGTAYRLAVPEVRTKPALAESAIQSVARPASDGG